MPATAGCPVFESLDATCPRANRRVAAAIRMQNRERIGGARLAANGDEHTAATRQGFENAAVVGLKSDPSHRAGDSELRQVARGAPQRVDEGSTCDDGPDVRQFDAFTAGPECFLDERVHIRTVFS